MGDMIERLQATMLFLRRLMMVNGSPKDCSERFDLGCCRILFMKKNISFHEKSII